MSTKNYNCDGSHCMSAKGEVRLLPTSLSDNSAVILCHACYRNEVCFREERNKKVHSPFPLPKWEDLKVYPTE